MGNYDFKRDLVVAKKSEKNVANILIKTYKDVDDITFSDNGDYDILAVIDGERFTIEVKEDFMCSFTGNVALEFECRGKPSGINTSKADYYIYIIHSKRNGKKIKEYMRYKIDDLKVMVKDKKYFRIVSGGDPGSNTKNYLFKYDVFVGAGTSLQLEIE
jgi:hypothetical protein